jgi:indole-3-glycerol phosphate synthase
MGLCRELKMEALVEVHDKRELDAALRESPGLIGINNRNLKDLSVRLDTTFDLVGAIPKGVCVVSESGIGSADVIRQLRRAGVHAALIGESILRSTNPRETLKSFVEAGRN